MQTLVYPTATQECTLIVSATPVLVAGTHEVTFLADLDLGLTPAQKDNTMPFSFPLPYCTQLCGFLLLTHVPTWQFWTLCTGLLILRSGQLSQQKEDATSEQLHAPGTGLCEQQLRDPRLPCDNQAKALQGSPRELQLPVGKPWLWGCSTRVVPRGNNQTHKQEAALQRAASCESICTAQGCCSQKKRMGVGAMQNTADEELLLPDPAPRLDRRHTHTLLWNQCCYPKYQILFPWCGNWYPKFQLGKFSRDQ